MIRDVTLEYLHKLLEYAPLMDQRFLREACEHQRRGAQGLVFTENTVPVSTLLWAVSDRKKNRWTPYATVLFMYTHPRHGRRFNMGQLWDKARERMQEQGARRVKAVMPTFSGVCWGYRRALWMAWGVTSQGGVLFDTPFSPADNPEGLIPEAARAVTSRPKPLAPMELRQAIEHLGWEECEWRHLHS